jgi:hypothetical protein
LSIIEAASAGVRDMADGSLRITLEFEPRNAREAYSLFGARGAPVAVVALKAGHALKSDELPAKAEAAPAAAPKAPLGPLAMLAVRFCQNPDFRRFAAGYHAAVIANESDCAQLIRDLCMVESRRDIDGNEFAAEVFHEQFRKPFQARE